MSKTKQEFGIIDEETNEIIDEGPIKVKEYRARSNSQILFIEYYSRGGKYGCWDVIGFDKMSDGNLKKNKEMSGTCVSLSEVFSRFISDDMDVESVDID